MHRLTDKEARTQRKVDAQYRKSKEQQKTQVGNFIGTLGAVSLLAAIHSDDKDGILKKGEDTPEEIKNYWIFRSLLLHMV